MKASKSEIEEGKSLFKAAGWLSRTPEPFRDALLSESQWLRVETNMTIARGGDTVGGMYGVAQGSIGVIPAISTPDAGLIHIDRAPFWFGVQPFLTGEPRQVTVQARSRCIVAHVSQPALAKILGEHPDGWRMLLIQTNALAALAIQGVADLLLSNPHRRCAAVLLRLAGARNPGATPHEVSCSHDELAAMCNLSRSSVSLVLKTFEQKQLIELGYRSIRIAEPDRLRNVVDAC